MGRIPRSSMASEETSYFATPTYHSYGDELHALKLKTHHAEPSSLWHAATKFSFLDVFRRRTPTSPTKEPLRRSARLINKNRQPAPKAFSWPSLPSLGTVLTYCSYALAAVLVILMAGAMVSFLNVAKNSITNHVGHWKHVREGKMALWYAGDRQCEAHRELHAALAQLKPPVTEESLMKEREARRKYEEARDKFEEIKAALEAQGIHVEFHMVSQEEYEAWRAGLSPEYMRMVQAIMESKFPCTPSRTAELNDHQQKKE